MPTVPKHIESSTRSFAATSCMLKRSDLRHDCTPPRWARSRLLDPGLHGRWHVAQSKQCAGACFRHNACALRSRADLRSSHTIGVSICCALPSSLPDIRLPTNRILTSNGGAGRWNTLRILSTLEPSAKRRQKDLRFTGRAHGETPLASSFCADLSLLSPISPVSTATSSELPCRFKTGAGSLDTNLPFPSARLAMTRKKNHPEHFPVLMEPVSVRPPWGGSEEHGPCALRSSARSLLRCV